MAYVVFLLANARRIKTKLHLQCDYMIRYNDFLSDNHITSLIFDRQKIGWYNGMLFWLYEQIELELDMHQNQKFWF